LPPIYTIHQKDNFDHKMVANWLRIKSILQC